MPSISEIIPKIMKNISAVLFILELINLLVFVIFTQLATILASIDLIVVCLLTDPVDISLNLNPL